MRVPLGHRRVRGWVIEEQESPDEVALREIHSFVSLAATDELVALARFGAWRYSGRLRAFLVAASPDHNVRELREAAPVTRWPKRSKSPEIGSVIGECRRALAAGRLRLCSVFPPASPASTSHAPR